MAVSRMKRLVRTRIDDPHHRACSFHAYGLRVRASGCSVYPAVSAVFFAVPTKVECRGDSLVRTNP